MIPNNKTLVDLIKNDSELSPYCNGRFSFFILHAEKEYCALTKAGFKVNCCHLYNYSDFKNACLYRK